MPGSGWSPSGVMGDLDSWTNPLDLNLHGKLSTTGDFAVDCAVACHGGDLWSGVSFEAAALSTDLSDDHPISMPYPTPAQDPDFETAADVVTAGLKLFGGSNTVECSSCHNVHDPGYTPFLRKDNAGSALCYACHIK